MKKNTFVSMFAILALLCGFALGSGLPKGAFGLTYEEAADESAGCIADATALQTRLSNLLAYAAPEAPPLAFAIPDLNKLVALKEGIDAGLATRDMRPPKALLTKTVMSTSSVTVQAHYDGSGDWTISLSDVTNFSAVGYQFTATVTGATSATYIDTCFSLHIVTDTIPARGLVSAAAGIDVFNGQQAVTAPCNVMHVHAGASFSWGTVHVTDSNGHPPDSTVTAVN